MPAQTVLHVVPHTHWDREWYEPFEGYRFRLVKMVDRLLWVLENDPAFRHFHFDGQTAAIEDYLEVRPEAEERVARLVRDGRLGIGPWRVLMDEFLCSPETLLRNLQQGRRTADRFGRCVRLGYIPDSFGHIAQMPQVLRLAGLTEGCVWRGVPRAVDRAVFSWEGPDGSRLRTVYLATSYSNGASLPESYEDLIRRGKRIIADLEPFAPGEVVLAMNGADHYGAAEGLPQLFAEANARQDEIEFRIGSMEEYVRDAPSGEGASLWHGEMRSGARANLLMGVASARMPLKQAEFRASTLLERYAEPLSALAGTDPGTLLDRAWRAMVENSAHDSICGCGIDAVADAVAARYENAAGVAELVATDALQTLASRVDTMTSTGHAIVAFNPSPFPRAGTAEITVTLPGSGGHVAFRAPDGTLLPAQVLSTEEQVVVDMRLRASQLARIVPTVHSRTIGDLYINEVSVEEGDPTVVHMRLGERPEGHVDVERTKQTVEAAIRARPRGKFHVIAAGAPRARALVPVPEIGGLGWTVLSSEEAEVETRGGARTAERALENEHLRVAVRPDGSIDLFHKDTGTLFEGLLGLEDSGDAGDEYNYSPPERDRVVRAPAGPASIEVLEPGPLQASLCIATRWRVPGELGLGGRGRSRRTVTMPVETDLTVRAGEPFLRALVRVENSAADHRLRAIFPLPFQAERSHADGAFHVAERGLVAEGGPHEAGIPTFPSRRWVDASDGHAGLAVLHQGTPEYELVNGRAIAVTLLRGVGWLARQGMQTRAGPAGPALMTPGAQVPGPHRFRLAIYPHAGDWRAGRVHRAAESYAYEFSVANVQAQPGDLPLEGHGLEIEPESVQLSALVREKDGIFCRVYNASPERVRATLRPGLPIRASRAETVDLFGAPLQELAVEDGCVSLPLGGWEIVTLRFT
jgi:alpha-mannosidase